MAVGDKGNGRLMDDVDEEEEAGSSKAAEEARRLGCEPMEDDVGERHGD